MIVQSINLSMEDIFSLSNNYYNASSNELLEQQIYNTKNKINLFYSIKESILTLTNKIFALDKVVRCANNFLDKLQRDDFSEQYRKDILDEFENYYKVAFSDAFNKYIANYNDLYFIGNVLNFTMIDIFNSNFDTKTLEPLLTTLSKKRIIFKDILNIATYEPDKKKIANDILDSASNYVKELYYEVFTNDYITGELDNLESKYNKKFTLFEKLIEERTN